MKVGCRLWCCPKSSSKYCWVLTTRPSDLCEDIYVCFIWKHTGTPSSWILMLVWLLNCCLTCVPLFGPVLLSFIVCSWTAYTILSVSEPYGKHGYWDKCLCGVYANWHMQTKQTTLSCASSMFMLFFLLRHPTKPCYCDVTMHAPYFFSRGKGKILRRECPTYDKKEGKVKGKLTIGPRMKNGRANLCSFLAQTNGWSCVLKPQVFASIFHPGPIADHCSTFKPPGLDNGDKV